MTVVGPVADRSELILGRIKARRWQIAFTYFLTLLENGFTLVYPWAIGLAINGLITDAHEMIAPLVVIWITHIAVGGLRQVYDTNLFSRLYASIASDIVMVQKAQGEEVSEISARVDMAYEIADFMEEDVPRIMAAMAGLLGGVAMLFFYDFVAGAIMAFLLVPVGIINAVMGSKALRFSRNFNNEFERQVDVIDEGRRRPVLLHFGRLAQWRIRLSNADAASWTLAEGLALIATVLVLFQVASQPGVLAGTIFASIAYVLRVIESMDEIPGTVQNVMHLIDIRSRISNANKAD